ncbi:MAG: hypothetical protein AAB845_03540 [Patescibacteria group bacterium]
MKKIFLFLLVMIAAVYVGQWLGLTRENPGTWKEIAHDLFSMLVGGAVYKYWISK